jgi:hypothetical protein
MATPPDIDQAFLERSVGAATVARWFDDDGDGVADASIVADYLARATATARGKLSTSFPAALIDILKVDEQYQHQVAMIALGLACQRKPEWMNPDGSFPYERQMSMAKKELLDISKGVERLYYEKDAPNPTVNGSSRPGPPLTPTFAATKNRPGGPGGF